MKKPSLKLDLCNLMTYVSVCLLMSISTNLWDSTTAVSKYWSPGRPEDVPRTSPKNPIWPSRGRPELTSWGCPYLTYWGRLEMTSWCRPNLTSKERLWEVVSVRPLHVLRTSPRLPWKHVLGTMWDHLLDVPKFLFTFLSELSERSTKSI